MSGFRDLGGTVTNWLKPCSSYQTLAGVIDDDGESPKAKVLDFNVETWFNNLTCEEILLFSYV
jgi:hypothetical protein